MADQLVLPEGQDSFKLNEVCKLANVQPYMLRFWGTEFEQLEAAKSGTGQRLYSRDQVELILEIRRLLFDEGLTIAGARKRIGSSHGTARPAPPAEPVVEAAPAAAAEAAEPPAPEPEPAPALPPRRAALAEKLAADEAAPLLTTLRNVRTEVAKIVAELKRP
ncbi:MAG TPA: MerR family transcriptional regulator [Thermoanaerobaculales bacterium]|nr:MerR family transcriptional regulator [Thermoanaerobaculales bacterium]